MNPEAFDRERWIAVSEENGGSIRPILEELSIRFPNGSWAKYKSRTGVLMVKDRVLRCLT